MLKLLNNLFDTEEYHLKLKFPQLSAWLNKFNGSCQSTYRLNLIGIAWTVRFLCQVFRWSLSFSVFSCFTSFLSGKRCFFSSFAKKSLDNTTRQCDNFATDAEFPKIGLLEFTIMANFYRTFFSCTQMKFDSVWELCTGINGPHQFSSKIDDSHKKGPQNKRKIHIFIGGL